MTEEAFDDASYQAMKQKWLELFPPLDDATRQELLRKEKLIISSSIRYLDDTTPEVVMGCQILRVMKHDPNIHTLEFNDLTKLGLEFAMFSQGDDFEDEFFNSICCNTGFLGLVEDGMTMLGRDVVECTGITSLLIRGNCEIFGDVDYFCLLDEMSVSWSIVKLQLHGFTFTQSIHNNMLAVFSITNLTLIELVECNMTEHSTAVFTNTIEEACPRITELSFRSCRFEEGQDVVLLNFLTTFDICLESLVTVSFKKCHLSQQAKHILREKKNRDEDDMEVDMEIDV